MPDMSDVLPFLNEKIAHEDPFRVNPAGKAPTTEGLSRSDDTVGATGKDKTPMIVDAQISYRTDFVPRRSRNVRRGHASESVSFLVRELSSVEAPVVLQIRCAGRMRAVRTVDGLLYEPVVRMSGEAVDVQEDIRSLVLRRIVEVDLVPETDRLAHAFGVDASCVSSHRDFTVSHLTRWLEGEAVLVDGNLHRRVRSPMIPLEHLVKAFGTGAEIVGRETGSRLVQAWFPPTIDGERLATVLSRLATVSGAAKDVNGWRLNVMDRMDVLVADEALFETVSRDPRNLDLKRIVEDAMSAFKRSPGRGIGTYYPGGLGNLQFLLEALAESEAVAGTDRIDIERMIADVARPSEHKVPVPGPETTNSNGLLICFRIEPDLGPVIVKNHPPSQSVHIGPSYPFLFFRLEDYNRVIALAKKEWKGKTYWQDFGSDREGDVQFDVDGWNLKVAMAEILASIDGRVRLLPKHNVDALVRIATHLRDWRTDTGSVADPGSWSGLHIGFLSVLGYTVFRVEIVREDRVRHAGLRSMVETGFLLRTEAHADHSVSAVCPCGIFGSDAYRDGCFRQGRVVHTAILISLCVTIFR